MGWASFTKQTALITAAALSIAASSGCALRTLSLQVAARGLDAVHPYDEPGGSRLLWSLDPNGSLYFIVSQYPVRRMVKYDGFIDPGMEILLGGGRIEETSDTIKPSKYALYRVTLGNGPMPIERICSWKSPPAPDFVGSWRIHWADEGKISNQGGDVVIDLERCVVERSAPAAAPMTPMPFMEEGYRLEVEDRHLVLYDKNKKRISHISLPISSSELRYYTNDNLVVDLSPNRAKAAFYLTSRLERSREYIAVVALDGSSAEVFLLPQER